MQSRVILDCIFSTYACGVRFHRKNNSIKETFIGGIFMRKLLKYLRGYEKESIIGPLFKMLEATFELIVPIIMANIIDIGIKNKDTGYILKSAVILVLLGVLGLACSLTAQYFAAKAAMGFGTALRSDLFWHISGLSYTELDVLGTSTLITRMTSDINQAQAGVNLVLRLFLRSPFIVIGAFIMAFTISKKITIIFAIAIVALTLIIYGVIAFTIPLYKKVQKKLDLVSRSTRENLAGVRVVRAFSRQKSELEQFENESNGLYHLQMFVGKISALMNPATYIVVNLAIIAIIWQGGIEVDTGNISQGDVTALVSYMTQILLALVALSNLIVSFTKATASASRINHVFDIHSSLIDEGNKEQVNQESKNKVEFRNVEFSYKNAQESSLRNITFEVKKGQTIGVIGGTGSGKTSLVHLIPRFYDATGGDILIDGIDVTQYPLKQLRKKVGIVPQKAVLFAGTLRENMQWGKKDATDEEIYLALEIAQAKEFIDAKEEGLDLKVLQGGKNFSGGQRQRLTIARALVGKPEILILDDSASALDYATDAKLRSAIANSTKDMTVFIVSQRAASMLHADQIIVLDDGEMVGSGTHEQLLETCDIYNEIYSSQL